jgi:hypothetical protein
MGRATLAMSSRLAGMSAEDDTAMAVFYGDVKVPKDDYRAIRRAILDLPRILETISDGQAV